MAEVKQALSAGLLAAFISLLAIIALNAVLPEKAHGMAGGFGTYSKEYIERQEKRKTAREEKARAKRLEDAYRRYGCRPEDEAPNGECK